MERSVPLEGIKPYMIAFDKNYGNLLSKEGSYWFHLFTLTVCSYMHIGLQHSHSTLVSCPAHARLPAGPIMQTWATCKPQKTLLTCTHWSTTIPSRKMGVHKSAFMSLFTRQSGRERVLPSQDSENTQQQFNRARPRSIKVFLPAFYPWRHSREEMYQAPPTLPYCKWREAGRWPGNETSYIWGWLIS